MTATLRLHWTPQDQAAFELHAAVHAVTSEADDLHVTDLRTVAGIARVIRADLAELAPCAPDTLPELREAARRLILAQTIAGTRHADRWTAETLAAACATALAVTA